MEFTILLFMKTILSAVCKNDIVCVHIMDMFLLSWSFSICKLLSFIVLLDYYCMQVFALCIIFIQHLFHLQLKWYMSSTIYLIHYIILVYTKIILNRKMWLFLTDRLVTNKKNFFSTYTITSFINKKIS